MKNILIALCFFAAYKCNAQQDTLKVEQYCELEYSSGGFFRNKVSINYGLEKAKWKDQVKVSEQTKIESFKSIIDALNYLGKNGWKLVNASTIPQQSGSTAYYYILKKEFAKTDAE